MHTRQSTELEVLTIIQQNSYLVGPSETFSHKVPNETDRNELLNALREHFGYGKVPPHINTPRDLANWIADCRCLGSDEHNFIHASLKRSNIQPFRLAA